MALHRAAYLLYAHRRMLERSGVLVVGPSHTFLRYIDQVLPSLGETGVVTATVADLVPGVRATATEADEVAEIKGRAVMATVLARAVRQRQRVPAEPVVVRLDGREVTITPADVADAIGRARRTGKPHNLARVTFVRDMLARLAQQYVAQLGHAVPAEDRAEVVEELRSMREVRVALNLAWMPLTPQKLVGDLLTRPARLEAAARELSRADRARLLRDPEHGWTAADVPLLDEVAEMLGEDDQAARAQAAEDARRRARDLEYARQVLTSSGAGRGLVSAELLADRFSEGGPLLTTAERAAGDRTWTYGHVVVDEAQELSAMAWRMLLRRCPTRSMTIVGDVAQTASSAGARSWARTLDPVLRGSWRLAELTVNYRTPAEVARTAQRVAREARLPVSPLTSAREVDQALEVTTVAAFDGALVDAAARALEVAGAGAAADDGGRVAVIAAPARVAGLTALLAASPLGDALRPPAGGGVLDAPLAVLGPRETKGLEFDVVVLVEPTELEPTPGDLYVAMTRPTRRLHVLTTGALPAGLEPQPSQAT